MNVISYFFKAFSHIFKDKVNFILMLIPLLVSALIYTFGFYYIYDLVMEAFKSFITSYVSDNSFIGSSIFFILKSVLMVLGFFIVNWTFVLIASVISSPFNDIIGQRVERKILGKELKSISENFTQMLKKIGFTIINEIKKIIFIAALSILAFSFSYIPFFTPFALLLTFLLIAIQFVDYSWSRHDLAFGKCVKNLKSGIGHYTIAGALYFLFINIPLINLLTPALATAHFSAFYTNKFLK